MYILEVSLNGKLVSIHELHADRKYTVGRGNDCDIVLEDVMGLSRNHFVISCDANGWRAECVSKFGSLEFENRKMDILPLVSGTRFSINLYYFHFFEKDESVPQVEDAKALVAAPRANNIDPAGDFPDSDLGEETFVRPIQLQAQLRIESPVQKGERSVVLENGETWFIGRDSSCAIHIPDPRISRKHLEIKRIGNGFFVIDLGSANGTYLNGKRLTTQQQIQIESGDVISVIDTQCTFEIRDPSYNDKAISLPQQLWVPDPQGSQGLALAEDRLLSSGEMISEGQLPYPSVGSQRTRRKPPFKDRDKMIIFAVIALVAVIVFELLSEPRGVVHMASGPDPLNSLSERDRSIVIDTYSLATKLINQGKYNLAKSELDKIHKLLPMYKDSREMEEKCKTAIEFQEYQSQISRTREDQARTMAEVALVLAQCEAQITPLTTVPELERCLMPVREKDPGNPRLIQMIEKVEMASAVRKSREDQNRAYQEQLARSRNQFDNALNLLKTGQYLAAKSAFNDYIASPLPDPGGLKNRAKREIASIDDGVKKKVRQHLNELNANLEKEQFKKAILSGREALKIDPNDGEVKTALEKVIKKQKTVLKSFYEESILEESIGEVDVAKNIWKKILDLDVEDGEYYNKVKKKLKLYGDE